MKNTATTLFIFLLMISFVTAGNGNGNGCNGAIWTTDATGTIQNKNHYLIGEGVYLNAENFDDDEECTWEIKRLPNTIIASGSISTDSEGSIDAAFLYTTQPEDAGSEYKVTLTCDRCNKHDNYRVLAEEIPEFSTVAALVALVGSLAIFMIVRKKH